MPMTAAGMWNYIETGIAGITPYQGNNATDANNYRGTAGIAFCQGIIDEIINDGIVAGTTGSIGGSLLNAGSGATGTVTIPGATTGMVVSVSPVSYPGPGFTWMGYVSSANTVTVVVVAIVSGTPIASQYNVAVLQQ